ncbi:MAG: hypothetical protein H6961_10000 [Chromatiaceae bacterium]|nr:hypothetical protein [Chromatiaceae bacterium]
MPTIAKLVVQLNLNDSQYQKGVTAAINQAKRAEQNISSSTNKLQQTAQTKFNAVGNGFSGLAGKLESIGSTISDSFHKVGKGLAIGLAAGITAVTAAVIVGGKRVLELGADANETASLLETSLGPATEYLNSELKDFASNANRSFYELQAGSSTFVAMTKSMGATQDQAANLGVSFTKAATDLGSFFNVPTEQALQDIQSALAGSSETLTKYGIDIRETTLKQMALDQGLISSASEVLPQLVRAQLIQQAITEQGADAMGDAIRTSDSWQNSMRGLKGRIRDFATEAGKRLIPVLSPILSIVSDLAERAMPYLSDILDTVTPIIQSVADTARKLFDNIQMGMRPVDAISVAIEGLIGSEAAQWFRNTVASVQEFMATVQRVLQPVYDAIASIVQWQDVAIAFAIAVGAVVIPIIWSILSPILVVIATIAAVIAVIAVLRTAWENNWGGIQEKTAAAMEFVRGVITSVSEGIRSFWAAHGEAILATAAAIWEAIKTAVNAAITTIQTIIQTISTAIQTFWATHGEAILAKAQEIWDFISSYIETAMSVISSVFAAFKAAFEGDWTAFGEKLREAWDTAWEFVKTTFTNAKDSLIESVSNLILDMIAKFTSTDWGQLGRNVIDGILQGLANGLATIIAKMEEIGEAAWNAWQGFWNSSSPSKLAMQGARNVTDGFLVQWNRDENSVAKAMSGLGRAAWSSFDFDMQTSGLNGITNGMIDRTALATTAGEVNQPFNMYGNVSNGMSERELETKVRRWIRDENRKR